MSKSLKIIIPGVPVPKHRPRFAKRGKFVTTYSDQVEEENAVRLCVKSQVRGIKPYPEALALMATFFMPIPTSHSKKKQDEMLSGKIHHVKRPDADNMLKFYLDCMNGIAFVDDSQIVVPLVIKRYDNNPRIEITLVPMYAMTGDHLKNYYDGVFGGQIKLL
jgi:Holliday junction resolvase RusA-like endonuclease